MNNKLAQKLWFVAAACFLIAGAIGKNTVFFVLGCAYIAIGASVNKRNT